MRPVHVYVCHACGAHLASWPGESFPTFKDRVYRTHAIRHDAQMTGLPAAVLLREPWLGLDVAVTVVPHPERV